MVDWRYTIDIIRNEVRKARSEGSATVTLDNLENALDVISSDIEQGVHQEIEEKLESSTHSVQSIQREHWERYIAKYFEELSAYNRLIIAGSYVAFFTVWVRLENVIDPIWYKWSALLVGISLTIFAIYEIYSSFKTALYLRREESVFSKDFQQYKIEKEKCQREKRKNKLAQISLWFVTFSITLLTGMLGGGLLMAGLFANLIGGGSQLLPLGISRQQLGILICLIGTVFIAFSVKVRRQRGIDLQTSDEDGLNRTPKQTSIDHRLFWGGLACVFVGTALQW